MIQRVIHPILLPTHIDNPTLVNPHINAGLSMSLDGMFSQVGRSAAYTSFEWAQHAEGYFVCDAAARWAIADLG